MVTLTINYGYDVHSIQLNDETYAKIKAGILVEIDGQGFTHEEVGTVTEHWVFNREPNGAFFWLDNGAEFHAQDILVEGTE